MKLEWDNVRNKWREDGIWQGAGRYRIRKVENNSVGNISRIKVVAVLRYPKDVENKDMIREIVHTIIKKISRKPIYNNPGVLQKRKIGWFSFPKYVWVSLYKSDGTIRWLNSGGWAGGNLIAIGEKIYGSKRAPIFVPKPEEIWRGIRFQYTMDLEAAAEAIENLIEFANNT